MALNANNQETDAASAADAPPIPASSTQKIESDDNKRPARAGASIRQVLSVMQHYTTDNITQNITVTQRTVETITSKYPYSSLRTTIHRTHKQK